MRTIYNKITATSFAVAFFFLSSSTFLSGSAFAATSILDEIIKKAEAIDKEVKAALARKDLDEAIHLSEEELTVLSPNGIIADYILYGNAAHQQAMNYSAKKQWDDAILNEERAIASYKKMKVDEDIIGSCTNNISKFYFDRNQPGDLDKAIKYGEQALDIYKGGSKSFFNTANNLIVYYVTKGKIDEATNLNKKIRKKVKTIRNKEKLYYADYLEGQSIRLRKSNDIIGAIDLIEESMAIYKEEQADSTAAYARVLKNAANLYKDREDYNHAIELFEQTKQIIIYTEGTGSTNYITCLSELASAYNKVGNLEKANDYIAEIQNSSGTGNSPADAQARMRQAAVFAGSGNYKSATLIAESAINIFKQYKDTIAIANATTILSSYYNGMGNYEKAISTCYETLDIYSKMKGHETDEALALGNIARYCYTAKNFEFAMEYGKSAIDKYKEAGDTLSSFYAKSLGNYAIYCQARGELDNAIKYSKQAYEIQAAVLGERHPDNVINLFNIAAFYDLNAQTDTMQMYYSKAIRLQSEHIKHNFSHLSTAGREMYWSTKRDIFNVATIYAYMHHDNDSLLRDAYNACLLTKGILLNSEVDFRETLLLSGNTELLEKYNKLGAMVKRLETLSQEEIDNGEADRMQQQITRLEREVMRESKLFGDFTENMSITVKELSENIRDDEAAVELFDLKTSGGHAYYALIMRKGWKVPRYAFLFNDYDLREIEHNGKGFYQLLKQRDGVDYLFSSPLVGSMVWDHITDAMGEGVKDIYFSPSGLFYHWGIEYLKRHDGKRINETYGMHRLSSTKTLAQRKARKPFSSAVVYGGIDYNIPFEVMQEIREYDMMLAQNADTYVTDSENMLALFDSDQAACDTLTATRGSVDYLPGTAEEADAISSQLRAKGISVSLFKEEQATEESFKALNGKKLSTLHIATHGFALNEDNKSRQQLALLLGASNAERDMSMNFSGLLFAGANNVLRGQKAPEGLDNGILTSKEISIMDLRGLDLVVLSACQTGLGEIKEDGVFGLQRGFKKAGANTILMSLWSVSDQATQLMMTSFYENILAGAERREAFNKAQEHVRNSGFTDPYYWASFILLDDK